MTIRYPGGDFYEIAIRETADPVLIEKTPDWLIREIADALAEGEDINKARKNR